MELKQYQQAVLDDLAQYIDILKEQGSNHKAFSAYWGQRGITLQKGEETFHPYCDTMNGAPNMTVKVPTAGGKTFIACNALRTLFDAMPPNRTKVVAWFVPSDTILKQTYENLRNPQHPYRQRIDTLFNGRVEVYDKQALLFGQNFNPTVIKEQLSIFVLSIQSFATKATDKRLVYNENENLAEFVKTYSSDEKSIEGADETSLIRVIAHLNPVMIIDESHNFEGDLRTDTLTNIKPCFVLNLTATPRNRSNIISFVDPASLKRENMVKLPVMVSNYQNHADVLNIAIALRDNLEEKAKAEEVNGGDYIRPIVLIQAQPRNDEDSVTFSTIRAKLVKAGIPEEEIKIKTASLNELKGIDLMGRECPVRYIITVNALKEGWDCPFAYILASTANRSSRIDVEQILGRILRQPYTRQHGNALLNMSYVLTSSADFHTTIDNVVESLRMSGYSRRDYVADDMTTRMVDTPGEPRLDFPDNSGAQEPDTARSPQRDEAGQEGQSEWDFEPDDIITHSTSGPSAAAGGSTLPLLRKAEEMSQAYNQQINKQSHNGTSNEIMQKANVFPIRKNYEKLAEDILLPRFYVNTERDYGLFGTGFARVPVTQEVLLEGFSLSAEDRHIEFNYNTSNIRRIDIDKNNGNDVTAFTVKEREALELENFYGGIQDKDNIIVQLSKSIGDCITQDNSLSDGDLRAYITNVLQEQDLSHLQMLGKNLNDTIQSFKAKVRALKTSYAKRQFEGKVRSGQISLQPTEHLPGEIILTKDKAPAIDKKMYQEEEGFNGFERTVIEQVISLDCVRCWHRNQERGKGFCINGFVNAYPDFIIVLHNGITVMLETKGNHLDGSDSRNKLACGDTWSKLAGPKFYYFMVFENSPIEGAVSVNEFIKNLQQLGANQ